MADEYLAPADISSKFKILSADKFQCPAIDDDVTLELFYPWLTNDEDEMVVENITVLPQLQPYQLYALEKPDGFDSLAEDAWKDAKIVGGAHAVPFHLAALDDPNTNIEEALESLPTDGWSSMARNALSLLPDPGSDSDVPDSLSSTSSSVDETQDESKKANVLGGLMVSVDPEYRRYNLAEILVRQMRAAGQYHKLRALLIPVRPTRKSEFPDVPMSDYIWWTKNDQSLGHHGIPPASLEPYDPWLRKHWRLGAKIIKVADESYPVKHTIEEWEKTTGIPIRDEIKSRSCSDGTTPGKGDYYKIRVAGGLTPVYCYPQTGYGEYMEPNVWMWHSLEK